MIVRRRGRVGKGVGRASLYTAALDLDVLGWTPTPGTLNVRFADPVPLGRPMWTVDGHRLWAAQVSWVPAAIIRWPWDRRTHSYELVAPVRLRATFGLVDADLVDVNIWAGESDD